MAELTDTLATGNSAVGTDMVAPARRNSNFIGGLTDLANGVFDAAKRKEDTAWQTESRNQQRKVWARDDAKAAEAAQLDDVLDQTEGLRTDLMTAANDFAKKQKGVQQGAVPQSVFDLGFESKVNELYAKYPEFRSEIGTYLQGRNFDSMLFRDAKNAADAEKNQADAETSGKRALYDMGIKAGGNPDSYEETITLGREQMAVQAELKLAKDRLDLANTSRTLSIQEKEFEQKQGDRQIGQAMSRLVSSRMTPLSNALTGLIDAAGDDAGRQKVLSELMPQVQNGFETFRVNAKAQAIEAGATPEVLKQIDADVDRYAKSFTDIFTGELSSYNIDKMNIDSMGRKMQLDAAKLLPMYSQMKGIFGQSAMSMMFSGDITTALNPELLKKITGEVGNYDPTDPESSAVTMNNITQIIKGNANLRDLTPDEAKKALPTLVATMKGAVTDINKGDVTPLTLGRFTNTYSQVLNAGIELSPATADLATLGTATNLVATRAGRTAMATMIKDPNQAEQGRALMQASRATSYHLLNAAKGVKTDNMQEQFVEFNAATGKYYVAVDVNQVKQSMKRSNITGYDADKLMQNALKRPANATLQRKVETLNQNLDHLVETAPYDDELPKGVTPKQLRAFYAKGTVPPGMGKDPAGKPTGADQFNSSVESFRNEIHDFTMESIETSLIDQQGQSGLTSDAPRGIRNNNPGNIEDGAFAKSLPGYAGSDGRFAKFDTAEQGEGAQVKLLQNYGRRGYDTPAEIINRWAPPSDNNPTGAYAAFVAKEMGVGVNDRLNLDNPQVAARLAAAIKKFENG